MKSGKFIMILKVKCTDIFEIKKKTVFFIRFYMPCLCFLYFYWIFNPFNRKKNCLIYFNVHLGFLTWNITFNHKLSWLRFRCLWKETVKVLRGLEVHIQRRNAGFSRKNYVDIGVHPQGSKWTTIVMSDVVELFIF